MARSTQNETTETPETTSATDFTVPENSIYMSVDGYIGFLPMVNYENLSASENVAINEGRKQIALRKAQTVARKAAKENKPVREAVQAFLDTFSPNEDTEFQTVADKKAEIARGLLTERLKAAGKPSDEGTVEKNLAAFMAHPRHSVSITDTLNAWALAYTPPKKRGTGAAGTATGEDVDLDSLD